MVKAWYLQRDGTYRRLSVSEDLISDAAFVNADARVSLNLYREVRAQAQETCQRSLELVKRSQRERRLRNTKLRIVQNVARGSRS